MKRKCMAAALGISFVLAFTSGCGSTSSSGTSTNSAADAAAVESTTDDAKEAPEDQEEPEAPENPEAPEDQDAPEEMEAPNDTVIGDITALGDNTITVNDQEITLSDDTEITKMAGGPGGEAPEKPSGDGNAETPPEKPSGDGNMETPPEKPSGDGNAETPPEKPSGDRPEGKGDMMPPDGKMPGGESITFSDLAVGDHVMIVLAEDGTAASVTVSDENIPMGEAQNQNFNG